MWKSVSPTQRATTKCGSPYPKLKGPNNIVGVRIKRPESRVEVRSPKSRGHTRAWELVSPM